MEIWWILNCLKIAIWLRMVEVLPILHTSHIDTCYFRSYVSGYGELLQYLAGLHQQIVLPQVIIIDDLHLFIKQAGVRYISWSLCQYMLGSRVHCVQYLQVRGCRCAWTNVPPTKNAWHHSDLCTVPCALQRYFSRNNVSIGSCWPLLIVATWETQLLLKDSVLYYCC